MAHCSIRMRINQFPVHCANHLILICVISRLSTFPYKSICL